MRNEISTIDFYGDKITAVLDRQTNDICTPLKLICEALGIDYPAQYTKIKNNRTLSKGVVIIPIPTRGAVTAQDMFCIRHDLIPLWLTTININKVKPELQKKLELYQDEAAKVLAEHFLGKVKPKKPRTFHYSMSYDLKAIPYESDKVFIALRNKISKEILLVVNNVCQVLNLDSQRAYRAIKKANIPVTNVLVPNFSNKLKKSLCFPAIHILAWFQNYKIENSKELAVDCYHHFTALFSTDKADKKFYQRKLIIYKCIQELKKRENLELMRELDNMSFCQIERADDNSDFKANSVKHNIKHKIKDNFPVRFATTN